MNFSSDILEYYRARAREYEQVYEKPERQHDLARLHTLIPRELAGRQVLEIACGTGYWTRYIATRANSITACDLAPEVLAVARSRSPREASVTFLMADAFKLVAVPGEFDAAFAGFWWSHMLRRDVGRFLAGLHCRLARGSRVMLVDNRYVEGSNWPITRTDEDGNTYQRRKLNDGAEYEVLKNFPRSAEISDAIETAGGGEIVVCELEYYWYATYEV